MTSDLTAHQRDILARTLLGEAAGEGSHGMQAVAHVIQNRALSGRYPSDPAAVALQPLQFSAWNSASNGGNNLVNTSPSSTSYQNALQSVDAVFGGADPDPTGGALNYYAPQGMKNGQAPSWAQGQPSLTIGNQVFLPQTSTVIDPLPAPSPLVDPKADSILAGPGSFSGLASLGGTSSGSGALAPASTEVRLASGKTIAPGIYNQGDHQVQVADDGNGNAVISTVRAPGAIPGVTGGLGESNSPTLVGDMIRSKVPDAVASAYTNATQGLAGLGSGLQNTAANAVNSLGLGGLTSTASNAFSGLAGLFGGGSNASAAPAVSAPPTTQYTQQQMQVSNPAYLKYIAAQNADPIDAGPGSFAGLSAMAAPPVAPPQYITQTVRVPVAPKAAASVAPAAPVIPSNWNNTTPGGFNANSGTWNNSQPNITKGPFGTYSGV